MSISSIEDARNKKAAFVPEGIPQNLSPRERVNHFIDRMIAEVFFNRQRKTVVDSKGEIGSIWVLMGDHSTANRLFNITFKSDHPRRIYLGSRITNQKVIIK
jgi:hypothetical protein